MAARHPRQQSAHPTPPTPSRATLAEARRPGGEGWAGDCFVMRFGWGFDPARVEASVTWAHGDDDKAAPLAAARRGASRLRNVELRVWRNEGRFASLIHDREI